MKKNRIIILLTLLLSFTACDNMRPDISITVQSDYNSLIEAVSSSSRSLAEKLQLIEAAVASGFADEKAAQELLRQAISSLSGSLAQKLEALEAAMNSQTTALETKLGLIEAAATAGFAETATQQALIEAALQSLGGTLKEKLAAVESAIGSKTAGLELKLALIETAVKEGFADEMEGRKLVQQAVQSLSGTLAERLEAIGKAMDNNASSLSAKLNLMEEALKNRLADSAGILKLMNQALESLTGTAEEKLAAIEGAIEDETAAFETKLVLIEAAVTGGFAHSAAQQQLLQQAVVALKGTAEEKMTAITAAIESQGSSLSTKLDLIETAVKEGFADGNQKAALISSALASLSGDVNDKLSAIGTAITNQADSLTTKLEVIQVSLQDSLASANDALRLLKTALGSSLPDVVEEIAAVLDTLDMTLYPSDQAETGVIWMITKIRTELKNRANIDYSVILGAIERSVYYLTHNIGGYEYVELGHFKGTGPVLKWATMNLGTSRPQEAGDYFAWGATDPYYSSLLPQPTWKAGKEDGYVASTDQFAVKILNNNDGSYKWGYRDDIYTAGKDSILRFEHDAARQQWGASWRIPTQQELIWLSNPELFEWTPVTSYEGVPVKGMVITSKEPGYEGNSIFLPVTGGLIGTAFANGTSDWGYYWSSTVTVSEVGKAQGLAFWDDKLSSSKSTVKSHMRYWGFAIRPVSY